jgi:hypothetical protein
VFVRVTLAPATGLPEGSATVPSIVPVLACDCPKQPTAQRQNAIKNLVRIHQPTFSGQDWRGLPK